MRKLFSTFFVLLTFGIFLLLPFLLAFHTHGGNTHHGEMNSCLEHCLGAGDYFTDSSFVFFDVSQEVLVMKLVFKVLVTFSLPLLSLYLFIYYPPPNFCYFIQNYSYSMLRGIVISTT